MFLLQEMDETEKKLKADLDNLKRQASVDTNQSMRSDGQEEESNKKLNAGQDKDASDSAILEKLEKKNKELVCCNFNLKVPKFIIIVSLLFDVVIFVIKDSLFFSELYGGSCKRVGEEVG